MYNKESKPGFFVVSASVQQETYANQTAEKLYQNITHINKHSLLIAQALFSRQDSQSLDYQSRLVKKLASVIELKKMPASIQEQWAALLTTYGKRQDLSLVSRAHTLMAIGNFQGNHQPVDTALIDILWQKLTCDVIAAFKYLRIIAPRLNPEQRLKFLPLILKKLYDSSDRVRQAASDCMLDFFAYLKKEARLTMIAEMITNMDDPGNHWKRIGAREFLSIIIDELSDEQIQEAFKKSYALINEKNIFSPICYPTFSLLKALAARLPELQVTNFIEEIIAKIEARSIEEDWLNIIPSFAVRLPQAHRVKWIPRLGQFLQTRSLTSSAMVRDCLVALALDEIALEELIDLITILLSDEQKQKQALLLIDQLAEKLNQQHIDKLLPHIQSIFNHATGSTYVTALCSMVIFAKHLNTQQLAKLLNVVTNGLKYQDEIALLCLPKLVPYLSEEIHYQWCDLLIEMLGAKYPITQDNAAEALLALIPRVKNEAQIALLLFWTVQKLTVKDGHNKKSALALLQALLPLLNHEYLADLLFELTKFLTEKYSSVRQKAWGSMALLGPILLSQDLNLEDNKALRTQMISPLILNLENNNLDIRCDALTCLTSLVSYLTQEEFQLFAAKLTEAIKYPRVAVITPLLNCLTAFSPGLEHDSLKEMMQNITSLHSTEEVEFMVLLMALTGSSEINLRVSAETSLEEYFIHTLSSLSIKNNYLSCTLM